MRSFFAPRVVGFFTALVLAVPCNPAFSSTLDLNMDFDMSGQFIGPEARRDAMLDVLRDYGDFRAVINYLDLDDSDDPVLQGVHAASLAAAGDTDQAMQILRDTPTALNSGWGKIANALVHRQIGDLDTASAAISEALEMAPGNAFAHNVAGTISVAEDDWEGARKHFSDAARLGPEGAIYHANLGGAWMQLGTYEKARSSLDRAIDLNGAFCAPRLARAELNDLLGQLNRAVQDLQACLDAEQNPVAARALIVAYIEQAQFGPAASALSNYRQLLDDEAHALEAELALRQGKADAARSALAKAQNLSETNRALNTAYTYLIDRNYEEAAAALAQTDAGAQPDAMKTLAYAIGILRGEIPAAPSEETAGALVSILSALSGEDAEQRKTDFAKTTGLVAGFDPFGLDGDAFAKLDNESLRENLVLGILFLERSMNEPAVQMLAADRPSASDAQLSPVSALSDYLLGVAHARLGQRGDAEAALKAAVEAAPGFVSANLFLGEVLARQARFAEALPFYQAANEAQPTAAHALRYGVTAETVGDTAAAERAYRQLISLTPQSYVGYNQLAWLFASQARDLDEAEDLARTALELAPGNGPTLDTLGWTLFQKGDLEPAIEYLRQAYAAGGASAPLIAFHLAQAEAKAENFERAGELLTMIASYGPDAFVFSRQAEELLQTIN